jgi:hypothetical protein
MEKLIFIKSQILKGDDYDFILSVYDKFKKNNKLILSYDDNLLFIDNDFNKIKNIFKDILTLSIQQYNEYLFHIDFYNIEKYNRVNNKYKLLFIDICLSNENNKPNDIYIINEQSYSTINCIFCLDDLFITILNKKYDYKIGDLIIFPSGWSFFYKIEISKRYALAILFT